jgi:hypothetical protein
VIAPVGNAAILPRSISSTYPAGAGRKHGSNGRKDKGKDRNDGKGFLHGGFSFIVFGRENSDIFSKSESSSVALMKQTQCRTNILQKYQ